MLRTSLSVCRVSAVLHSQPLHVKHGRDATDAESNGAASNLENDHCRVRIRAVDGGAESCFGVELRTDFRDGMGDFHSVESRNHSPKRATVLDFGDPVFVRGPFGLGQRRTHEGLRNETDVSFSKRIPAIQDLTTALHSIHINERLYLGLELRFAHSTISVRIERIQFVPNQ
jgi:hypothetical protein